VHRQEVLKAALQRIGLSIAKPAAAPFIDGNLMISAVLTHTHEILASQATASKPAGDFSFGHNLVIWSQANILLA
jgi:hypothetical protein